MPDELLNQEIQRVKGELMLKLQTLAWSAGEKYLYYNAKQPMTDLGISLPKNFRAMKPGVGWASRAVNTISDRLNFDGFADDLYGINDLFDRSGANAILNKAKTDALIAGCSFIALLPRDGYIELLPFTATEATGTIDERTGLLSTGLAVVAWDSYADPVRKDMQGWGKVGLIPRDYFVYGRTWTALYRNNTLVDVVYTISKPHAAVAVISLYGIDCLACCLALYAFGGYLPTAFVGDGLASLERQPVVVVKLEDRANVNHCCISFSFLFLIVV